MTFKELIENNRKDGIELQFKFPVDTDNDKSAFKNRLKQFDTEYDRPIFAEFKIGSLLFRYRIMPNYDTIYHDHKNYIFEEIIEGDFLLSEKNLGAISIKHIYEYFDNLERLKYYREINYREINRKQIYDDMKYYPIYTFGRIMFAYGIDYSYITFLFKNEDNPEEEIGIGFRDICIFADRLSKGDFADFKLKNGDEEYYIPADEFLSKAEIPTLTDHYGDEYITIKTQIRKSNKTDINKTGCYTTIWIRATFYNDEHKVIGKHRIKVVDSINNIMMNYQKYIVEIRNIFEDIRNNF